MLASLRHYEIHSHQNGMSCFKCEFFLASCCTKSEQIPADNSCVLFYTSSSQPSTTLLHPTDCSNSSFPPNYQTSAIPPSGASDVLRLLCCATHHSVFMKNPIIPTWCYKIAMFHHVKCLYGGFYETHLVGSWSGASPWQQRWPSAPFENEYYSILSLNIFLFVYILNWK